MATRLKDVEENGFTPPKEAETDSAEEEEGDEHLKQRSSSIREDAKKRKKKKKKQLKREQSETSAPSSVQPKPISVAMPAEEKVDPLVTALLAMGFMEDQIHEAARACGGLDRATADQMVMWILSGGEESPSSPSAARIESNDTSVAERAFVPTSRSNANSAKAKPAQQQLVANLKRAQQQNAEAAKCEEEARAVAERLAAKREEQRRRNREWNNRAQARQKEEMEHRAQEEAMRIAMERAAIQQRTADVPVLAENASAKSAQTGASQPPAPMQILQRPSHMPVGGIPAGMLSTARPYPTGPAVPPFAIEANNMMRYSSCVHGEYERMSQYISSGNSVSSAGSGSRYMTVPHVSSGNSVSSAGSGKPAMAQFMSSGNSVSSLGSGMQSTGMIHQTQQPMYGHPTPSVPPPGFHAFGGAPAVSAGSSSMSMSEVTSTSFEESSASGEIRATARAFVPTGFKPAPHSTGFCNDDPLGSLLSATAAPGMTLRGVGGAAKLTPFLGSTTEESDLNSAMGFDLNGPSVLVSLSTSSANDGGVGDSLAASSSIWGSSSLAPASASLSGFGTAGVNPTSKTGDAAVGSGSSGMWNSGLNQGGSGLGSIW